MINSNFKVWLKLADYRTWMASILPVTFGSTLSWYLFDHFNALYFFLSNIGMILIQSATNMFNDYTDFIRKADTKERADEKALSGGEINLTTMRLWMILTYISALSIGIILSIMTNWIVLIVVLIGTAVLVLYSSGPFPICYTPFGEIVAGITMGIGITVTVMFLQVEFLNPIMLLLSVPTFLFIGMLLLSNNLADWKEDKIAGRRTLPIVLGTKTAQIIWLICAVLMVLISIVFYLIGSLPALFIILVIVFFPFKEVKKYIQLEKTRSSKPILMKITSLWGMKFHLLCITSMILSKLLL